MRKLALLALLLILPGCINWFRRSEAEPPELTRSKLVALDVKLDEYKSLIGEYPTLLPELIEGPSVPELRSAWTKPLAIEEDLVDGWNMPFFYKRGDDTAPYLLYSKGEPT